MHNNWEGIEVEDYKFYQLSIEPVEKLKDERAIVHFISTPDLDWGGDVVNPKGMDDTNFSKSPTVFFNHNYNLPVAKSLWRKKKDEGVLAKTVFSKTSLFADDIYNMHEEGILNTWSIGFVPKIKNGKLAEDAISFDESKGITYFNKWDLLEYSSAQLPMNPNALDQMKTLIKSMEGKQMVDVISLKAEVELQLGSFKSTLDEISEMKKQLEELINLNVTDKLEMFQKDILDLTEKLENKIETKAETLGKEKIDSIIRSIVAGEVSKKKSR
jgi:regulator of replication initiation timing